MIEPCNHPEATQVRILRNRVTELRAERDEARATRDAYLAALAATHDDSRRRMAVVAENAEIYGVPKAKWVDLFGIDPNFDGGNLSADAARDEMAQVIEDALRARGWLDSGDTHDAAVEVADALVAGGF